MGEVVSSLEEFYHAAELPNLILTPVAMAKALYLRMDTHVVFLELCERGLYGIYTMTHRVRYSRKYLLSIMTSKGLLSIVIYHILKNSIMSNARLCLKDISSPEVV